MAERIAVGDSVRFNVVNMASRFPRADTTVNSNSPMTVMAIDDKGESAKITVGRQGVEVGVFSESELVKVDPDTGLPPEEAPPPDTLPGGTTFGGFRS